MKICVKHTEVKEFLKIISHSIENINKETEIMKKSPVDSGSEKYNKWNKNLLESSTVDLNW